MRVDWSLHLDVNKDEIYGSAYAAAVYISSVMKLPKDKKVYVIGMSGIEEELREEGVSFINGTVSFLRYSHFCNVLTSNTRTQQTAHSNPSLWLISHQTRTSLRCCVASIPRSTIPNSQRLSSTSIGTPHVSSSSPMRTARSPVRMVFFWDQVPSALPCDLP